VRESPHRDWFGLDLFTPGPPLARREAACYLLEEVGSTSDFLLGRGEAAPGRLCRWEGWGWQAEPVKQHAPLAAPEVGTLVVARRQRAGRGRQGRSWLDCGGLQMSWVLRPEPVVLDLGLGVWVGLIVAALLRERFGLAVRLKWPNDLLVDDRKLGGLLLDRIGPGPGGLVVAGLGLNLSADPETFPGELQGRATSVKLQTGLAPRPAELVGPILSRFDRELPRFTAEGWRPYAAALERNDWLRGRAVTLTLGPETVSGRAVGIDESGCLVLSCPAGDTRRFRAGEVHLTGVTGESCD